ncbi:MAG: winged helix-turn-helix transcriptional regulator [Candidatus Thorarchaeota archaeon]
MRKHTIETLGCDFLKKRWSIDKKDLKILTALDRLGGNASAQQISDYIHDNMQEKKQTEPIPARTIRYRLSTLIERGLLLPSYLQTDERRVGLGEGVLLLQEGSGMSQILEKLIQSIPIFYWYVPTHGKYDGYLVHTVFDIKKPEMILKITKAMKEKGIIKDFAFFDIVDNASKKIDFTKFRPNGSWVCDWNEWMSTIESNLTETKVAPFNLKEDHSVIEYDWSDIMILRVLKNDADSTMNSLASITGLPIQHVRERVQKLREKGVIKGYARAYGFVGDLLWFSCFMRIRQHADGILKCIQDLPFPGVVLMENRHNYCVRFGLTTSNLKRFLDGFRFFRPHLEYYYFQFHLPDIVESKYEAVFDMFDRDTDSWKIPVDDYASLIRKYKIE